MKAEIELEKIQNVFTSLTSFLPHFFKVKISINMSFEHEIWVNFRVKKVR